MKVLVIADLPDHHGSHGVPVKLAGKEIDVEFTGMRSECGGILFEVLRQEDYWTPDPGEWLGVCSHEIKQPAASSLEGNNTEDVM